MPVCDTASNGRGPAGEHERCRERQKRSGRRCSGGVEGRRGKTGRGKGGSELAFSFSSSVREKCAHPGSKAGAATRSSQGHSWCASRAPEQPKPNMSPFYASLSPSLSASARFKKRVAGTGSVAGPGHRTTWSIQRRWRERERSGKSAIGRTTCQAPASNPRRDAVQRALFVLSAAHVRSRPVFSLPVAGWTQNGKRDGGPRRGKDAHQRIAHQQLPNATHTTTTHHVKEVEKKKHRSGTCRATSKSEGERRRRAPGARRRGMLKLEMTSTSYTVLEVSTFASLRCWRTGSYAIQTSKRRVQGRGGTSRKERRKNVSNAIERQRQGKMALRCRQRRHRRWYTSREAKWARQCTRRYVQPAPLSLCAWHRPHGAPSTSLCSGEARHVQ